MIIIDRLLAERAAQHRPIRVGLVGAGFAGRGVAHQLVQYAPGMALVGIANRTLEKARGAFASANRDPVVANSNAAAHAALAVGRPFITDDALLLCRVDVIDVIVEATGTVEFAATTALAAIENGKHLVLMNAELGGTLGPVLKARAERAGLVLTDIDGDQPGAIMNLFRFVQGIGARPVLCGNIKGLLDRYRTPATQVAFASEWGLTPHIAASFADGTKLSFEQTLVANATGFRVARRGMWGPEVSPGTPVREAAQRFDTGALSGNSGIVDYIVGAEPSPGVFVLARYDDGFQQLYLDLYKMGGGPLYCFYIPYHLAHFEIVNTVARAVLFSDAAVTPSGPPMVEVIATAKRNLAAGELLDGVGHDAVYGQCENHSVARRGNLLPIGLAEGCQLLRAVRQDEVLTFADIRSPLDRVCDRLWREQCALFALDESDEPDASDRSPGLQ